MPDLSPLAGAKRKLDLGAVRAAFEPKHASAFPAGNLRPGSICPFLKDGLAR